MVRAVFGPMARHTAIGSVVLKPFVKKIIRALKSSATASAVIVCVPPARNNCGRKNISTRFV